jgi:glycosyltransferase involved in cell wall biosynthesis
MNILYVVQNYYPEDTGGAGRSVQMLAEAMAKKGHQVSVARLTDQKVRDKYTHNGVTVYALPMRNIYYYYPHAKKQKPAWMRMIWHAIDMFNPFALLDFSKLLNEVKPDVVNTNTLSGFSTSLFYITKWKGIKLVHTMRDYYLMCPQSSMYKNGCNCENICGSCKPFSIVRRLANKNVDVFLANSQFVLDHHRRHNMLPDTAKQYVQYNMNGYGDMGKVRTIDKTTPIRFGFIGNLIPTKGTDILIKATNKLESESWSLVVAGTGPDEFLNELKQISRSNVSYLGWSSPADFYGKVDVLICSSTYQEPLPRVIYEAYKSGLPVIASDKGGNPEIIEDGITGYTYPAYDIENLAGLLKKFIEMSPEEYTRMSEQALRKAEYFEPENILAEYEQKITA